MCKYMLQYSHHIKGEEGMDAHQKKKIAPIVITVLIVLYYLLYFCLVISLVPVVRKGVLAVIPAALGGAMLYVCMERIKEIDGGEEDDLSKY